MKLTAIAIARPFAVSMGILALVLMGLVAHSRLAVDLLPSVAIPVVSVSVAYPGASPSDMETLITKPVEDTVAGLPRVDHVSSTSVEGLTNVTVTFADGTDVNVAAIDVERAVNSLRASLPAGAQPPSVQKFDTSQQAMLYLTVSGNRPQDQLFNIADQTVKTRLEGVDGVAAVSVFGGLQREIDVAIDPARLQAHNVTLNQVVQALGQGNQTQPSGAIEQGSQRYDYRVIGEARTPADLGNLVVSAAAGGPVRVSDVATVQDTYKTPSVITRANGHDGVAMAIFKQSTANSVTVADNVRKTIASLQDSVPPGVKLGILFDTSITTKQSLADVNNNLIAAIILTGVVLFFFLHTFRSTFIVLLAIPTSLISTYAVMYALGFTLNMLSLMALALLIGILVDDSIVVLENITRHVDLGEKPRAAALIGRSEIGLAAIAITLVDVVVYTPVAFMSGTIGAFFKQFGLTITAATLFSLLVSFTLTPMLASRLLKRETAPARTPLKRFGHWWDGGLERLAVRYSRLVGWAIARTRRRWLVVGVAVGALLGSVALIPAGAIGTEFIPASDQGFFQVSVEMPTGTSLAGTDAMVDRLDKMITALPEVDQTLSLSGTGGSGGGSQARFGTVIVQLKPKAERTRTDAQLASWVQAQGKQIPGVQIRASALSFSGDSAAPISYRIQGPDLAELTKLGDQAVAVAATVPGAVDVKNSGAADLPEVHVQVDQAKLADFGLTTGDVANALRTTLQGTVATQYQPPDGTQVDVRVIGDSAARSDPATILNLPLTTPGGAQVALGQVAQVVNATGPSEIDRYDRQRQITVSADLADGYTLGPVNNAVKAKLDQIALPPGYKFVIQGAGQSQNDAFSSLLSALGFSVLLMYMLMVALYESLTMPFVIMFSLPMALVGALVALALTGNTLNVFSMIGLIMLMGLVAKNAILLVDYTNTLRACGLERAAAIREAGKTRLRPILMTTSSMVLAMLPLALRIGQGSETRSAMGVVLIGGLISSLLLTLLLVPVAYTLTEDTMRRLGRLGRFFTRPFRRSQPEVALDGPLPLPEATANGANGHVPEPVLSGRE